MRYFVFFIGMALFFAACSKHQDAPAPPEEVEFSEEQYADLFGSYSSPKVSIQFLEDKSYILNGSFIASNLYYDRNSVSKPFGTLQLTGNNKGAVCILKSRGSFEAITKPLETSFNTYIRFKSSNEKNLNEDIVDASPLPGTADDRPKSELIEICRLSLEETFFSKTLLSLNIKSVNQFKLLATNLFGASLSQPVNVLHDFTVIGYGTFARDNFEVQIPVSEPVLENSVFINVAHEKMSSEFQGTFQFFVSSEGNSVKLVDPECSLNFNAQVQVYMENGVLKFKSGDENSVQATMASQKAPLAIPCQKTYDFLQLVKTEGVPFSIVYNHGEKTWTYEFEIDPTLKKFYVYSLK